MKQFLNKFAVGIQAALLIVAIAGLTVFAQPASAGAYTDYAENKIQDYLFRGQASGIPSSWYVGLDTVACGDTGSGTEATGGSYARVAVVSSLANWSGTQSSGSTSASSGTGGIISNNGTITFPAPTANWGSVSSVRVWDASTSGNAWLCFNLATAKTINNGDAAPSFAAASLTIAID